MLHVMNIIKKLGMTPFAAIHDLDIASLYCDRILVMNDGCIVRQGTPKEIFDPAFIFEIFGVNVAADRQPITQKPQITYIPEHLHDLEDFIYSSSVNRRLQMVSG